VTILAAGATSVGAVGATSASAIGATSPDATGAELASPSFDPVERAELVMGTVARVSIDRPDATAARFEAAFAALRDVDRRMSLYLASSELRQVNAHAAVHPEPVGDDMFVLLARARELAVATDGAFDVTILPLLRAWGAYRELDLAPTNPPAVGYAGLVLDAERRTVAFRERGMGIDLGGIAKGFGLDRAAAALVAAGGRRAILDLGGNLALIGTGATDGWRIAVRDPAAPERPLGTLELMRGAVSTSANYARDFASEGWRAPSHIYDPRTRRPVDVDRAVTAWARDATTADALSTALMVLGPSRADAALARIPESGAVIIERRGGRRAITMHGTPPQGWEVEPEPAMSVVSAARR
jgi:thiamine biosynthesis lipoprotein